MKTTQQLREIVERERKSLCWGSPPPNDLGVLTRSIDKLQCTITIFGAFMIGSIHTDGWLKLIAVGFLVVIILCTVQVIELIKIRDTMIEKKVFTVEAVD
jgi:hypothetical protein